MVTREIGLDWIVARMNYINKITKASDLECMPKVFELDLNYLLDECLISFREHEILTRRALAELEFRREKLGKVLRFPPRAMSAAS